MPSSDPSTLSIRSASFLSSCSRTLRPGASGATRPARVSITSRTISVTATNEPRIRTTENRSKLSRNSHQTPPDSGA